ncbi:MAG: O-antigen ligase family protein [Catonella sp.]|nr:O-antigen ligase family protein [Catonella sp.]MDY6357823.1 O-antigen ligase family protein [Catonella sp.]
MTGKNKQLTSAQVSAILTGKRQRTPSSFDITRYIFMIPVFFVAGIVPLLTGMVPYDLGHLGEYPWLADTVQNDFFLLYKAYAVWTVGIIMAVMFALKLTDDESRGRIKAGRRWLIPLAVFGVIAVISTIASPFRKTGLSLLGGFEHHENLFILLCYLMIVIYSYIALTDEHGVNFLKIAFSVLTCLESLLGISQATGHDFFNTAVGKMIMVPEKYKEVRDTLKFNFAGSGNHQVYLTMFNPNYVGVYASMMLPICAVLIFTSNKLWKKIWWALMFIGVLISAVGCGSKTFMLSLFVSFVFGIILMRKTLKKGWPVLVGVFALALVAGGVYFKRINVNPAQYLVNALKSQKMAPWLTDVSFNSDNVRFTYNGKAVTVVLEDASGAAGMTVTDADGNPLTVSVVDAVTDEAGNTTPAHYVVEDEALSQLSFTPSQYTNDKTGETLELMSMKLPTGYDMKFTKTDSGYSYVTNAMKLDTPVNAPSVIWTDYPEAYTGRGYIWGRTIPLLKKHIVLGAGADAFMEAFPQNDYIGELNTYEGTQLISKPHNMYLELAVNEGLVALIIAIAILIIYIIDSFRALWKLDPLGELAGFGIALFLGVIGFAFAALTNDSSLVHTPLFAVILGSGFAMNHILRDSAAGEQ